MYIENSLILIILQINAVRILKQDVVFKKLS